MFSIILPDFVASAFLKTAESDGHVPHADTEYDLNVVGCCLISNALNHMELKCKAPEADSCAT